MKQLADPMDLDDKTKIDVVVVGSSAVHPESGIRVGKGEGFAELEYGIMRQLGMIDDLGPGLDMFHSAVLCGGLCLRTHAELQGLQHSCCGVTSEVQGVLFCFVCRRIESMV